MERGLGVFDADAASMANASYFGRRVPDDGTGLAPSFRAGCEGLTGAEELQRSAKESDIVIDSAEGAPGAVCGFVRLRVSEESRMSIALTLTLIHGHTGPTRRRPPSVGQTTW